MAFDFAYLKEHPYMVGGVVIAGAVGLFLITRQSGSSASVSAGGVDPTTAALYAQEQQTNAQLSAQNASIAGQQALATTQATYGIDIAQIQANAQTTQNNTAAQVALAQIGSNQTIQTTGINAALQEAGINANVNIAGIDAQLAGLQANDATTVSINQIAAQEQEQIASTTASVQKAQINAQTTQAGISAGGGLLGGLFSFL